MAVHVEIDKKQMSRLETLLKQMPQKAVISRKRAINKTAMQTKTNLLKKVFKEYAFGTAKSKVKGAVRVKKATAIAVGTVSAEIIAKGRMLNIVDYKVTPTAITAKMKRRPKSIKGKVLKASALKELKFQGAKAFVTKFKNGHIAAAVRVPGTSMKNNPKKEKIKAIYSPAPSIAIGSDRVFGHEKEKIGSYLEKEISKEIARLIGAK